MSSASQLVDAHEIGDEFGLDVKTILNLHVQREVTGFPAFVERAEGRGRTQYWDHAAVADWFGRREIAGSRLQRLAQVIGGGDPDELLNASQVARLLGYSSSSQILTYLKDHPGYFPEPDEVVHLGTRTHPRRRLRWRRRTVTAWVTERPGKGKRAKPDRPVQPLPEVDLDGDPDGLHGTAEAASVLGYASVNSFQSARSKGDLPLLAEPDAIEPGPTGRLRKYWTLRRLLEQQAERRRR